MTLFIVDKEKGEWKVVRATPDGPNIVGTRSSKTDAVKSARRSAKSFYEKHDGQVLLLVKAGDGSISRATKYRDGDEYVSASGSVSKSATYPYRLEVTIENPAGLDRATGMYVAGHYFTKRAMRDAIVEIGQ